jgi:hypothetical protein
MEEKAKLLLKVEGLGNFWGCEAGIFFDGSTIFCDSINRNYECDMSQTGFGMGAYCPLWGFRIELSNKVDLLRWWNYLIKQKNDPALYQVGKLLEEKFLPKVITCDICQRQIKGCYNLLHTSKSGKIICDTCFNQEDPKVVNQILFG